MLKRRVAQSHESVVVDWKAAVAFLPAFDAPGYTFGRWRQPEGQFGYYEYNREILLFIETLNAASVVFDFAWGPWQPQALRYWEEPARLDRARLLTLRKLLTLHLRKDRFVEGHLAQMLESGHITAILRRADYLVSGVKRSTESR
jgi:hypothetical protein